MRHYVALADLELSMWTMLALSAQRFPLPLPFFSSAGVKGLYHCAYQRIVSYRIRKVSHWVKYLCKNEDLTLDPQHPHESNVWVLVSVAPSLEEQRQVGLRH